MPSVFSKIISGDLPGHFVWKDELSVAFLSINPIASGHTLVIPKLEVDHWLDLPPEINAHLVQLAQMIGNAQMVAFNPLRVGMIIAGLEVPHTHLHVIPMEGMQDLDFSRATITADQSELSSNALLLRNTLESNGHSTGL
jgi:histidine triad (HIT) family protein